MPSPPVAILGDIGVSPTVGLNGFEFSSLLMWSVVLGVWVPEHAADPSGLVGTTSTVLVTIVATDSLPGASGSW